MAFVADTVRLIWLVDLNEVSAGISENGDRDWTSRRRLYGEYHSACFQKPFELRMDVVNLERGDGNPLFEYRFLKRLRGGVRVGFEHEFIKYRCCALCISLALIQQLDLAV